MAVTTDCPTCGHRVIVKGDTTQHYEPIGCLQLVDDHELCERETATLRETLYAARTELDRWGHGDMHYGNMPRDEGVVKMLAKIDEVLDATLG